MAKKPVRKPGRPAKRAPKVKVQRFAKGDLVYDPVMNPRTPEERTAQQAASPGYVRGMSEQGQARARADFAKGPGVLNEQPQGIPEQKRMQQGYQFMEGANNALNAARGANDGFMNRLNSEVGRIRNWDAGFTNELSRELGRGPSPNVTPQQLEQLNRQALFQHSVTPPGQSYPVHPDYAADPRTQSRAPTGQQLAQMNRRDLFQHSVTPTTPTRPVHSNYAPEEPAWFGPMVDRGLQRVGNASVQAPNDPLTANAVARARSGQGGPSAASAVKGAVAGWFDRNKGIPNMTEYSGETSADMGGAPASGYGTVPQWLSGLVSPAKASQYSPEQLAAIRQYATQRGLSPDMGMERNPPGPAGLARPPAGVDPYSGLVGAYKAKQPETGSMDSYQPSDSAPAAYLTGGGMDAYSPEPDLPSGMFARSGQAPSFAPQVYRQITAGGSIPAASTQTPGAVPAAAPVAQPSSGATVSREDSALRIGQPIDMKSLTPSDMSYLSNLQAAGGRVRTDAKGNFQGYEMPPDGRVSAAGLAQQVRTAGQGLNWDAFSPENVARARRESRPPSDTSGAVGSPYGNTQADYDNALLRKWYSMAPNERGAMPSSVMEAKHRGATPQDTAMNIARARIMESGLPPERISESLGKLEQIRAYLEARTANTAHVGRQDEMQAARDTETGRHNQVTEGLTREQQQAMAAFNQGRLSVDQLNAFAGLMKNQDDALFNQGKLAATNRELSQKEPLLLPIPAFDPTINEKANPVAYRRMEDSINRMTAAHQDFAKLASEHPGASPQELKQFALIPGPDGKLRAAAQAIDFSRYAGGGMVQSPVYGGPPSLPRIDPIMADYRQYVLRAQQQGVPTVPFEQFAQLKAGAFQGQSQQPVAMARGGAVPAAGKMVIDTNPNAKTDSIPAVIDGKSPARLDSGEFVIPADVVRHYGTKFLHSLIEKANGAE